jgi:phage tail-like protein
MDINGLKFWILADEAHWKPETDAIQFEPATRTLRLVRHRKEIVYPADEAEATARLNFVPQSLDPFGTRAFWSASLNGVMATGAVPGDVLLWTAPAGALVTDVALGYDNLLYIAVAGGITILDPRERFEPEASPPLAGFKAWRLAAHPDGGVWALDRDHNTLARLLGSPSLMRPHPSYAPTTVRPCVENLDPPRIILLEQATWPADEKPVAMASNLAGDLSLLFWKTGDLARVRTLTNETFGEAKSIAGVNTPFSITYISSTQVALLIAKVNEAVVVSLNDSASPIPPDGDVYPLKNHDGGPFLHTTIPPAHYPATDGPRGLYRLSLPSYARRGSASNHDRFLFDSGNQATVWHRLYLEADIPEHCGITVDLSAVNSPEEKAVWYPHQFGGIFPSDRATPRGAWLSVPSEIPYHQGLLQCPRQKDRTGLFTSLIQRGGQAATRVRTLRGRYLKARVTFEGNGLTTPVIAALRAYGGRFSYVEKYLPELYHEDTFGPEADAVAPATRPDFFERFIDNFEGILTPLESRIADSYLLTDADTVPPESLDWLGSWIGLSFDSGYTERQRRRLLKATPELYRRRGTARGLGLALDIATKGAVSRGQIVILEDFRLRRTFATILGADLADEDDPLLGGIARSGNSFVGDTLFLGDPLRQEFLALFAATLPESTSEEQAVARFFDQLANRVTILVHQEIHSQDLGLVRRVARLETPAHVAVRIATATAAFRAGAASLVGVDTYLAPEPPPRTATIGVSYIGRGDLIERAPALDPRLGGEDRASRRPMADISAPAQVEAGASFSLSATHAKAFDGRTIVKYIWSMLD